MHPNDPDANDKPCSHCEKCDPTTCPMGEDWAMDQFTDDADEPDEETCSHGIPISMECLECQIDEYEHPDEDQAPRGYRPRFRSTAYWTDNPAAVRY